jgi:8-amino-7-oxononanoate synthase
MPFSYERDLAELASRDRLRQLAPAAGADFTSNDYLGLAESPALRQAAIDALARGVPIGAGGSRLLRGNHPEHEALEAEAATFFGSEVALYFGGGFMANVSIFATLPQRGDLVVYDELIHASVHQGVRAGRADHVAAVHNDVDAFEDAIRRWRAGGGVGRPWIAVESLYSMDGDRAPLAGLAAIADLHDGMLVIDEAHATGVFGPDGRGLGAELEGQPNVVSLHTCGKALGSMGGLVCASRTMRDFLVNRCRPFIYATAPSPLIAATVRAALKICGDEPERREQLAQLIASAGRELQRLASIVPSGSQIQPVIVGSDARAVRVAAAMRASGYDVRAIRPPTVPEGTSRLRIALTLNVSEAVVAEMLATLAKELRKLDP